MNASVQTRETLMARLRWALSDVVTITQRNLIAVMRVPAAIVFVILQPVMFVLLFRYVFGGAITAPGSSYVNFLIPGILFQTTIFEIGRAHV